jgi:hypothetical protein
MTKLKFAVVFAVIVCVTGSFSKSAKAQMGSASLGGYCYTCGQFRYPHIEKPSSTENNSQTSPSSSIESLRSQQMECAERVKERFLYNHHTPTSREDPNYWVLAQKLQDECVAPFESR